MSDGPVTVEGKRAVVIGGTSGIGEAIALGFADDGADVVASSRSSERVADTAAKLRERGATTAEATCDVTDSDSLVALREAAEEAMGGVDVVVTSAGVAARERLLDLAETDWNRVLDVLLTGPFRATQVFAPAIETGSVVHVSSIAADLARSELAPYCAAKAGLNAFTRCAAKELAPDVRVNALAPGFVITPLTEDTYATGTPARERIDERTPMGRVAEREEMVGAAVYLASDAAAYTTGAVMTVDGGFAESAL
jgi:NAD(P)-dependent dehydrogenase (short-subunit alcohol dehydrogenase family)